MISRQADLSVCIPIHDPASTNKGYLREGVSSILSQTVLPKEIVFTSNHKVIYLQEILSIIPKEIASLVKIAPTSGASENFNNSVSTASGKYVKLLCQDDFLLDAGHFEAAINSMETTKYSWLTTGCQHFEEASSSFSRKIRPKYRNKLIRGVNTIGSPSVVMFKRIDFQLFSSKLEYMYDCEWYVKMFHNLGKPFIQSGSNVAIRIHKNQSTNTVSKLLESEVLIASQMHSKKWLSLFGPCACIRDEKLQ
jgi:glycosyltransferase involved in cell wall biosynthesis